MGLELVTNLCDKPWQFDAGVAKLVNATDLKFVVTTMTCGFKSRRPHQSPTDLKSVTRMGLPVQVRQGAP